MKKIFIDVDIDNHVTMYQDTPITSDSKLKEVEIEEDHDFFNRPFFFKYKDGKLEFDKDFADKETEREEELKKRPNVNTQLANLSFQMMNSEFEVENLKATNADLSFQMMSSEFELDNMKAANADLAFQLMMKGVL